MKTKDRNRLTRIVDSHGSEALKEKFREWQTGIGESPRIKEIEKIDEQTRGGLMEQLNTAEHEGDKVKAEEIAEQIKQMRKDKRRIIREITKASPQLEKLKNEVITEINNIIRTKKAHQNSTHHTAEEIQREAREHIADRASDLKKFSDIEGELYNFQQVIEKYNEIMEIPDVMNRTAETIAQVPFWTEKREQHEKKVVKWLADKEKPDPIIKAMPPELFQRIRDDFAGDKWSEHPDEAQRRAEIVPYMLQTVEKWKDSLTRKKKKTFSDDKKARSKADEPELTQ